MGPVIIDRPISFEGVDVSLALTPEVLARLKSLFGGEEAEEDVL